MAEKENKKKKKLFSHETTDGETKGVGKSTYKDNEFMDLKDLVYAPLEALADSNMRLQHTALQTISSMGTVKTDGDETVVHLNNTNLAYEHIKSGQDDEYSVENIQLQVPTLSLVPLNNLNVKKAEIGFTTEVRVAEDNEHTFHAYGKICSPEPRDTDFLPKVSYNMKVESLPATEGLLRILDMLDTSHVAKQLENKVVSSNGEVHAEEVQQLRQKKAEIRDRIRALNRLHKTISKRISQVQNMSNSVETEMPGEIAEKLNSLREIKTEIVQELMKLELDLTQADIQEQSNLEGGEDNEKAKGNEDEE